MIVPRNPEALPPPLLLANSRSLSLSLSLSPTSCTSSTSCTSCTARSFLEGATGARVEVAAPKHAALSRWARDPRPSRRWPGRHPPPSNHVPVAPVAPSHDVNARVDVADRDAPGFVPVPYATSVGMARTLPALGRAGGTHRPHNVLRKSLLLLPTNHVMGHGNGAWEWGMGMGHGAWGMGRGIGHRAWAMGL